MINFVQYETPYLDFSKMTNLEIYKEYGIVDLCLKLEADGWEFVGASVDLENEENPVHSDIVNFLTGPLFFRKNGSTAIFCTTLGPYCSSGPEPDPDYADCLLIYDENNQLVAKSYPSYEK